MRQLSCSVKPVTDYTTLSLDMGWTSLANPDRYHPKKIEQTNTQTNNINKQTNSDENSVKYLVIQDLSDHDALITQINTQTNKQTI